MLITKEHLPEIEEAIQEIEALLEVEDDASFDDAIIFQQYDITSFSAKFDVEGLVNRLNNEDILIPPFQRNYVWKLEEASRFIESLLLGLPIPNIFLARELSSGKLLVIDGQQRLKTLQFFYAGYFNPQDEEKEPQTFFLSRVHSQFDGKTYQMLGGIHKRKLDKSIIPATIVKQDFPQDDDSSIYYIFERLNSGGKRLTPQEIRSVLYHGSLIDSIKKLNQWPSWRNIFGKQSVSLKDEELILRFLAFYFNVDEYEHPLKEFLNQFASQNRQPTDEFLLKGEQAFTNTIDAIWHNIGANAFKHKKALNTAMFDSIMVGLARAMEEQTIDHSQIKPAYEELLNDDTYVNAVSHSTSNKSSVETRFSKAIEKFRKLQGLHFRKD